MQLSSGQRFRLWSAAASTSLLAVVLNALVESSTRYDLLSHAILYIVPIGAPLLAALCSVGYWAAAKRMGLKPLGIDFGFLLACNAFALGGMYAWKWLLAQIGLGATQVTSSLGVFLSERISGAEHSLLMFWVKGWGRSREFEDVSSLPQVIGELAWFALIIQLVAMAAVARGFHRQVAPAATASWAS